MKLTLAVMVAGAISAVVPRSAYTQSARAGQTTIARSSGVMNIAGTPHPYLIEGEGPSCIVVGMAPSYPPLFSDRLKQRIRFVYVDFKNSWGAESLHGVDKITMDSLVDEVDAVRRGLGLDKVCVVGHSVPAFVALEYALRYPTRVSHAILVALPPFYGSALTKEQAAFWEADASADRKEAYRRNVSRLPDEVLKTLSPRDAFALRYVRNGPKYFFDPSYDLYWAWSGRHFSAEMLNHWFTAIATHYDPRPKLANNTAPMLLVLGRYDYAVPYHVWNSLKSTPQLTYRLLDRSSHFPMIDEPDAFDDSLIRWLDTPR